MPELSENDLPKLFQAAGHQAPPRDLTDRIMARVAVTPIMRRDSAKPLISKRAWLLLGAGFLALTAAVALLPGDADQATGPATKLFSMLEETTSQLRLPTGSWPIWSAMAVGSMLLFTWIDGTLMSSMRRSAA